MVDPVILEVARRNLAAAAGLENAEFWREYGRIEDAALLCTEPEDHGTVIDVLSTCLVRLGKIKNTRAEWRPTRKTRQELMEELDRLGVDLPAILRVTPPQSHLATFASIADGLIALASAEDRDLVRTRLMHMQRDAGLLADEDAVPT